MIDMSNMVGLDIMIYIELKNMSIFDDEAKQNIKERLEEIEAQKLQIKQTLQEHPEFGAEFLKGAKEKTLAGFSELEPVLDKLIEQVKKIRQHVASITDRSCNAACYILFGKIVKSLRACNALARDGYYQEFMELARSITESLDLAQLFIIEGDSSPNLETWFDGIIVDNGTARQTIGADFDKHKETTFENIAISLGDYEKAKNENYRTLSKFNHSSFAALLDSYDRVNDDLDFADLAGYHFLQTVGVRQFRLMLEATFVVLRHFLMSIGDDEGFKSVTVCMNSFSDISSPERISQAKQTIEKFSEKRKKQTPPQV